MTNKHFAVSTAGAYFAAASVGMLALVWLVGTGLPLWAHAATDSLLVVAPTVVIYCLLRRPAERLSGQGALCETVSVGGPAPVFAHDDFFRSMLEHAPDAVLLEADGQVVYANAAMRALVGAPSMIRLSGRDVSELVPACTRDAVAGWLEELHSGKKPARLSEDFFQRSDGVCLTCETSSVPFHVEGKRGALMVVRDVTERNLAQDQARQTQIMETLGQLAGGLAHDFNNLLQVINGTSELVYESLDPANPMRSLLGNVCKSGEKAADLVEQLLMFSGQKQFRKEPVDLNEVVVSTISLLEGMVGARIQMNCKLAHDPLRVRGDRGVLEKVLMNLSRNALDAMPSGGVLSIATDSVRLDDAYCLRNAWARAGDFAVVRVADTGKGISREAQVRMFEPFFTTKKMGGGKGLGLSIIYRIVKQHAGLIEVTSEPGKGASFSIYLPVVPVPLEPPEQEKGGGAVSRRVTETLLLAEDDDKVRMIMSFILRNAGYTVVEARNGVEAVELFRANAGRISGVVMDVIMPQMGGFEASERIEALSPGIPVTFASAFSEQALQAHLKEGSEINLLHKPFGRIALLGAVRKMLDAKVTA